MASEREARIEAAVGRLGPDDREAEIMAWRQRAGSCLSGRRKHRILDHAVALMRTAPSAAPASTGRAVEELEAIASFMVGNCRKTDSRDLIEGRIRQRIAALRAEPSPEPQPVEVPGHVVAWMNDAYPSAGAKERAVWDWVRSLHTAAMASPEPQRAGAGLAEAAKELAEIVRSQCGGHVPGSGPGGKALAAAQRVCDALAAEQAREPDGPVITVESHNAQMRSAELRIKQAESAYKEAAAERQRAHDALRAYREQVEALRGRAVTWTKKDENVLETGRILEAGRIVSDLAALPTEPDGAKADAGDDVDERAEARSYLVSLLRYFAPQLSPLPDLLGVVTQIDDLLVEVNKKADAGGVAVLRRLREKFTHGPYELEIIHGAIDRLLDEAESQPEDDPNRDGPARPMPTETFSEDEPEREGDDVLRKFLDDYEKFSSTGVNVESADTVAVLAKRALEGR